MDADMQRDIAKLKAIAKAIMPRARVQTFRDWRPNTQIVGWVCSTHAGPTGVDPILVDSWGRTKREAIRRALRTLTTRVLRAAAKAGG